MPDKEPQFTVTDRRKFTLEGELRDESAGSAQESAPEPPAASQAGARPAAAEPRQTSEQPQKLSPGEVQGQGQGQGQSLASEQQPSGPTAEETSRQSREYDATTRQLDAFARQAGRAAAPINFSSLVQSIYMTALFQMGAAGEPNEQPQIDLGGARESIDMLGVLEEKTRGNLTEEEKRLLESALFGLRMSFLEITNAIAASAKTQPRSGKKP